MADAHEPIWHQHRLNDMPKEHVIDTDRMGNLARTDLRAITQTIITLRLTVHDQPHREAGDRLHMHRAAKEAKEQPKVKANIRHDHTIPKVRVRLRMTMAKDKLKRTIQRQGSER